MTYQPNVTASIVQKFIPLVLLFAIVAGITKRRPIGGWLMFFYCQIYLGALISALLLGQTYLAYIPKPWANETRHMLFITATMPRLLGFLILAGVATVLLAKRDLGWLSRFRFVFAVELVLMLVALGIDYFYFNNAFQANFGRLAIFFAWFAYFYSSDRVHRVFVTHDWTPPDSQMTTDS